MVKRDYTYWTKHRLVRQLLAFEAYIEELETECSALRNTVSVAVKAISHDNRRMQEWLDSQEKLRELQDPIDPDSTVDG